MSIRHTIATEGELLRVEASGFDENLDEVKAYGAAVVAAAVEHRSRLVLCNELELAYRLTIVDLYELAKYMAELAPHIVRIAIVCKPDFSGDLRFWENTAVNRGLFVKGFHDLAAARDWLTGP